MFTCCYPMLPGVTLLHLFLPVYCVYQSRLKLNNERRNLASFYSCFKLVCYCHLQFILNLQKHSIEIFSDKVCCQQPVQSKYKTSVRLRSHRSRLFGYTVYVFEGTRILEIKHYGFLIPGHIGGHYYKSSYRRV